MLRLKLAHKFFLAILLVTAVGIGVMAMTQRYIFHRGFLNYAQEIELDRLQPFIDGLASVYSEQQNWDWLAGRERFSGELLQRIRDQQNRRPFRNRLNREAFDPARELVRRLSRMNNNQTRRWSRLSLVDSAGQFIAGQPLADNSARRAITVNDQIVGYLVLAPIEVLDTELDLSFADQQRQLVVRAALVVFLLSMGLAFLFSKRLSQAIGALATGVNQLTQGQYSTRIGIKNHDELGSLGEDVNQLAVALEQGRLERQQWVADIAHELRTPVTILRGELEALQDGMRPYDDASVQSLKVEVLRLNALIDDLHQLSQADSGNLICQFASVDITALMDSVLDQMQPRLASKTMIAEKNYCNPIRAMVDQQRIHQLLVNLIENSLRYTHDNGTIKVTIHRAADTVGITVEDSAPAPPSASLPRLFDRLYRVDPSRSRETGAAGLGLAICAAIVKAHHGTIAARHSVLGGLAIDIVLPGDGGQTNG